MSGKKRYVKWICGIVSAILISVLLLIGCFVYITRYKITDIDTSVSPDNEYEVLYQNVGEPDWPFGYAHVRIVLRRERKTITKIKCDVANDGASPTAEQWNVNWEDTCAEVMISGEEQQNVLYTLYFDGTIKHESPEEKEIDISACVTENENGESVFAVPVADFIDCYNGVYRQTHDADYLNSIRSENWHSFPDHSTCFGYDSVRYKFSEDNTVWSMPTISLYAADNDEIYEVRMTLDHHGYQDNLFEIFKENSICMEKTLMQQLSEQEAETLFEILYDQSEFNFFGDHAAYGDPKRPQLNAVYQNGNIGMYCFYGSGNIEICFIPLTSGTIGLLRNKGIPLLDWME